MNEEITEENQIDDNHGFKEEVEYAGFWIRVGAALLDFLVFIPIIAFGFYNLLSLKSITLLYIITVASQLYKPLMEWKYGATLGKMACKIQVVNYDLGKINIDQAFGRYIPWVLSGVLQLLSATAIYNSSGFAAIDTFEEMGSMSQEGSSIDMVIQIYNIIFFIFVGSLVFDKHKRGFHDKIAKTQVIKISK
ncbi:MAG: hypothetical protein COA97_01765 [Flavobacteriales bacterium]|nr:MAG: hypothetical protein COA97_01765 [Flavobacteriales bacterium]